MAFDNITLERVAHPKKKPPVTNERFRVVGGPDGANIQILHEDCSGRQIFSEAEAAEIARQFLEDNPDPPPTSYKSQYVLYTVGGEKIWVFIACASGSDPLIMLPQNHLLEPVRTNKQPCTRANRDLDNIRADDIPAFEMVNKVGETS